MARTKASTDAALKELRTFGLAYPGAHLKSPWPGHKDLAVNDKTFAYLSIEGQPFSVSCKLPQTCGMALSLPFTKPTEYGLGKSGWVTAQFAKGEEVPVAMIKEWIEESYRAQAPKRLVATLAGGVEKAPKVTRTKATKAKAAKASKTKASKPSKQKATGTKRAAR